MLRAQFRKNAHTLSTVKAIEVREIKYDVVEKNVHGPKITEKKTESRLWYEKAVEKYHEPDMATYNPRDGGEISQKKGKATGKSFPKDEFRSKSPKGDFRRPLNPNLDAVKAVPTASRIAPEHEIVDSEMIKEYYETRGGPATYTPSFNLVEARPDAGIVKFV